MVHQVIENAKNRHDIIGFAIGNGSAQFIVHVPNLQLYLALERLIRKVVEHIDHLLAPLNAHN
jgi:hypothetical protein